MPKSKARNTKTKKNKGNNRRTHKGGDGSWFGWTATANLEALLKQKEELQKQMTELDAKIGEAEKSATPTSTPDSSMTPPQTSENKGALGLGFFGLGGKKK